VLFCYVLINGSQSVNGHDREPDKQRLTSTDRDMPFWSRLPPIKDFSRKGYFKRYLTLLGQRTPVAPPGGGGGEASPL